jgi:DNA-binding response OmpR family regulator
MSNPLANICLLIVEDDPVMTRVVKDMLIVLGFKNILTARDGASAISMMRTNSVEIVICDWKMHPMDGLELTRYIRNSPDSPDRFVPIIMLTGRGERKDVEIARDAGVTEYVVKPFTSAGLFDRVRMVIESPRKFVLAQQYKGPDRRRKDSTPPSGVDRRKG